MANVDYKFVIAGAVLLISLISIKGGSLKDPFKPYDDDSSKKPNRPMRRPWRRPDKPWRAESFSAEVDKEFYENVSGSLCPNCGRDGDLGHFSTLYWCDDCGNEGCDGCTDDCDCETKEAESFEADPSSFDDDDDERPTDWDVDKIHNKLFVDRNCSMCDRPYDFSKLSRGLVKHYLKESKGGMSDWRTKGNPDGTRRTARNIAGYQMLTYGLDALEHYMLTQFTESSISAQVVLLLRKSIVPQILVGDVTEFIKLLDIDDVEESPPEFDKDFWTKWDLEDYMSNREVFNTEHDDHDEIDALIKKLDDLNQFAITFMHDGGYGGEPLSKETDSEGLTTELIGYVEDSIRLKIISHEKSGEIIGIRISYTESPLGPVIYLPPADYIAYTPEDVEHEHDHDDHDHHEEEKDDFIKKLHED